MKIPPRLLAPFLHRIYRLWCSTITFTEINRDVVDAAITSGKPQMICLWHDELFPLTYVRREWPVVTVVSRSQDGEYLAGILEALGFKTARGSSSRGGLAALLRAAKIMRDEKYCGCITVDGPRGPRHKVKEGAIFLASMTPATIVPVRAFSSRAYRFASWDKFQLPLPFSRVTVVFGTPYEVPHGKLTPEQLVEEANKLQEVLDTIVEPPAQAEADTKSSMKYRLYATLVRCLNKVPLSALHTVAKGAAAVCWQLMPKRRKIAIDAVCKHLHLPEEMGTSIARKSFSHNFQSFAEIFYAPQLHASAQQFTYDDSPGLQPFIQDDGPVVVTTAHIGSWELMEPHAARLVPHKERLVVVRSQKDPVMNMLMLQMRTAGGVQCIGHRSASTYAMQYLRKNGLVAFLVDHNCNKKEAIFLPFLEDIAAVNAGPALLALRAKATIYPSFLLRTKDGKHHTLYIDEPLRTAELKGSIAERTQKIALHYTDAVARCIHKYPEQWFWMHKRWKTRP